MSSPVTKILWLYKKKSTFFSHLPNLLYFQVTSSLSGSKVRHDSWAVHGPPWPLVRSDWLSPPPPAGPWRRAARLLVAACCPCRVWVTAWSGSTPRRSCRFSRCRTSAPSCPEVRGSGSDPSTECFCFNSTACQTEIWWMESLCRVIFYLFILFKDLLNGNNWEIKEFTQLLSDFFVISFFSSFSYLSFPSIPSLFFYPLSLILSFLLIQVFLLLLLNSDSWCRSLNDCRISYKKE